MLEIGSRRELFVDRYLIYKLEGTELRLHPPERREVSLRFDAPWEGAFVGFPTVFQDGSRYRMYYRGLASENAVQVTCYAESRDGIHWEKPALGLHEVAGTRENNVVLIGEGSHNFAPFLDTRPGVPEDQRYKAFGNRGGDEKPGTIVVLAFASPDGLRWRKIQEEPVLIQGGFDSQNLAFWSRTEGCYVSYYRFWSDSPDWRMFQGKRSIARATSDDFLHWSDPVAMTYGDTPMEELYTNQTTPYFRAPHLYVALPKRLIKGRASPLSPEQITQLGFISDYAAEISEGVFMTTRGGNRYNRTFMEAFFRPGLDGGNWGSRGNMAAWGIVQTGPDEMSMYYTQHYAQPTCHMLRTSLRLDGFSSVHAGYGSGRMRTRAFAFAGGRLEINFSTSAAGSLRVEMQDEESRPLPGLALGDCPEIYGDQIEHFVAWKSGGDLSAWAGKPVRLLFELQDADLYSLRFADGDPS